MHQLYTGDEFGRDEFGSDNVFGLVQTVHAASRGTAKYNWNQLGLVSRLKERAPSIQIFCAACAKWTDTFCLDNPGTVNVLRQILHPYRSVSASAASSSSSTAAASDAGTFPGSRGIPLASCSGQRCGTWAEAESTASTALPREAHHWAAGEMEAHHWAVGAHHNESLGNPDQSEQSDSGRTGWNVTSEVGPPTWDTPWPPESKSQPGYIDKYKCHHQDARRQKAYEDTDWGHNACDNASQWSGRRWSGRSSPGRSGR
jgi:hypothetical protein